MHVLCFYIFCPSWLRWKLTYYLTGYVRLPLRLDAFNFRHWSQYLEQSAAQYTGFCLSGPFKRNAKRHISAWLFLKHHHL